MSKRPFSLEDRDPDRVTCQRCHEISDKSDVDRLLWCDQCRAQAKARAAKIGWVCGFALAALVAAYIWITVRPTDLIPQLWLAIPVAVVWLGARAAREIAYGVMRFRNVPARDGLPPQTD